MHLDRHASHSLEKKAKSKTISRNWIGSGVGVSFSYKDGFFFSSSEP